MQEEGLPSFKVESLRKAGKSHKAFAGVGSDVASSSGATRLITWRVPQDRVSENQKKSSVVSGPVFQNTLGTYRHYFVHQSKVLTDCVADPLRHVTTMLPGATWCVFLVQTVVQEALAQVFTMFPEQRIKVYVDDMEIQVWVKGSVVQGGTQGCVQHAQRGNCQDQTGLSSTNASKEHGFQLIYQEKCVL